MYSCQVICWCQVDSSRNEQVFKLPDNPKWKAWVSFNKMCLTNIVKLIFTIIFTLQFKMKFSEANYWSAFKIGNIAIIIMRLCFIFAKKYQKYKHICICKVINIIFVYSISWNSYSNFRNFILKSKIFLWL